MAYQPLARVIDIFDLGTGLMILDCLDDLLFWVKLLLHAEIYVG